MKKTSMVELNYIYDITTDEYRPVTQQDVDSWRDQLSAFGELMVGLKALREHALEVARGKTEYKYIDEYLKTEAG
jgi:hypothetical protein